MLQDEIGHGNQSVFLAEQFAVFLDENKAVHIRVDDHTEIAALFLDIAADVGQVLGQRLRRVSEFARRLAIEFQDFLHTEGTQHLRDGNAARRVDRIHGHFEVGLGNHLLVDQRQLANHVDMLVHPAVNLLITTDFLNRNEVEIVLGCHIKQPCTFGGGDKLALFVQKFQGVPLRWIVAGRKDNASIGFQACHSNFSGGCSAQSNVKHIGTHSLQSAANHLIHKESRKACIATDHDFRAFNSLMMLDEFYECSGEFHHVDWREVVARLAANGTTNAGYGFNKGHSVFVV